MTTTGTAPSMIPSDTSPALEPAADQSTTAESVDEKYADEYDKMVKKFGVSVIDEELLNRFEKLTGRAPHLFLRRGMFFAHRDLNLILDRFENGQPFYLYTGRGPSSGSLHLGHLVPFQFTQWLQEVFNVPVIIQLTDDEKFLLDRKLSLEQVAQFTYGNAVDIISCGFDLDKTFIFANSDFMGGELYRNIVRISRLLTTKQVQHTFGSTDEDSIGRLHFPAIQAAPSFSTSFPQLSAPLPIPCLIPSAIDQDPYFRLTRSVASRLHHPKPSLIQSKYLPSLLGTEEKMSASKRDTCVYLSDTPGQIKKKINGCAFSGGRETMEEHRRLGGDTEVDVAYQYLRFFLEDDEELERIGEEYRSGRLLTGELKKMTVTVLQNLVKALQDRKSEVTPELVKQFMDPNRKLNTRSSEAPGLADA